MFMAWSTSKNPIRGEPGELTKFLIRMTKDEYLKEKLSKQNILVLDTEDTELFGNKTNKSWSSMDSLDIQINNYFGISKNRDKVDDMITERDLDEYSVIFAGQNYLKREGSAKQLDRLLEKNGLYSKFVAVIGADPPAKDFEKDIKKAYEQVNNSFPLSKVAPENIIKMGWLNHTDELFYELTRWFHQFFFRQELFESIQKNRKKSGKELLTNLHYPGILFPEGVKRDTILLSGSYFDAISQKFLYTIESNPEFFAYAINIIDAAARKGWNLSINHKEGFKDFLKTYQNSSIGKIIDIMTYNNLDHERHKYPPSIREDDAGEKILHFLIKYGILKENDFGSPEIMRENKITNIFIKGIDENIKGGVLENIIDHYERSEISEDNREDQDTLGLSRKIKQKLENIDKTRLGSIVDAIIYLNSKTRHQSTQKIYFEKLLSVKEAITEDILDQLLAIEQYPNLDNQFFIDHKDQLIKRMYIEQSGTSMDDALAYIHQVRPDVIEWEIPDWSTKDYIASGAFGQTVIGKGIGGKIKVLKIYDPIPEAIKDMGQIFNDPELRVEKFYRNFDPSNSRISLKRGILNIINKESMGELENRLEDEDEKRYLALPETCISNVRSKDGLLETYASINIHLDCILEDELKKGKYSSYEEYMPLIKEILTAFSIVHKERHGKRDVHDYIKPSKYVHNDIKPSNIGFWKGQLKVFDFGIATTMRSHYEQNYPNLGSLEMKAPELKPVGDKPTTRSDVWQIGCLLYNIVAQNNPFDYKDRPKKTDPEKRRHFEEHERPKRIKEDLPKAIQHLRDIGIKEGLVKFIDRCLKIDPKKRYHNAGECLVKFKKVYQK